MAERFTVLIVGGGGREHALGWKFAQDPRMQKVWFAPGNAGTAKVGTNLPMAATDIEGITRWAERERPGLVVVGPEAPLCAGLADRLREVGVRVFGPGAKGAQLEGSKSFCKDLLVQQRIPTARAGSFTEVEKALAFLESLTCPIVVKADGLAGGKGVVIAPSRKEAGQAIREMMEARVFGEAGTRVLVEEFLVGGGVEFARGDGWQEFGLAAQCAGSQAGGRGRHGFEHGWNGGVCAGPKGDAGVIGGGGGEDFASDSGGIESAGDRLSGGFVCGVDADGGGSEGVGI